jgi:thiosulfate/3-mercaptopyruvate sulfurtransferase
MIRMSDFPLIVDPGWVQAHPDARLVDLRWSPSSAPATGNLPNAPPPPGLRKYEEGHLPGAVFVDLDRDLSSPGGPGRHPIPTAQQFAQVLSRLGIGPDTHVVVYDEGHSSVAARLWFMLRAFGHERASVLDGGMRAWTEAGLPLSKETPRIAPAPLRELRLDRSRIAEVADVQSRKSVVLDARAPERYRGEVEPLDRKAGHIPGAVNVPFSSNLTRAQRFRPRDELARLYRPFGSDVIVSCGSGVTACHDALAIELAGGKPARLYVGSFSGWIEDDARPVATGPEPG